MVDLKELVTRIRALLAAAETAGRLGLDPGARNRVESALHHIDKTERMLDAFLQGEAPASDGDGWLRIFGVMQALVVEQDAVAHLVKDLEVGDEIALEWKHRELRRGAVGHPVQRKDGIRSHITSGSDPAFRSFSLRTVFADGRPDATEQVEVPVLIRAQRELVAQALFLVLQSLSRGRDGTERSKGQGDTQ